MKQEKQVARNFPFPSSPEDGVVVFHQDMVCQYYAKDNTWACSRITKEE